MKPTERAQIVRRLQDAEDEIMVTKALEYASDEDTLANFRIIAEILNVAMPLPDGHRWLPGHICAVYWMKHVLAMLDNVLRGESLSEGLESRVLDARVYALLMYCIGLEADEKREAIPLGT